MNIPEDTWVRRSRRSKTGTEESHEYISYVLWAVTNDQRYPYLEAWLRVFNEMEFPDER